MPAAAWWIEDSRGDVARGVLGLAVREPEPEPIRAGTPWDLASLTKPLASAPLLLLLEQRGLLDVDGPVADWLPALRGSTYGSCSLLELALHRAGLPAWRPLYLEERTLDGYVARIAETPGAVPRGRVLYSDLGYILLGAVLEAASGAGLFELFERELARPLGLKRTGFAGAGGFADAAATERGNAYERAMAGAAGSDHPWRSELIRGEVHDANAHALGGVAGHAGIFAPLAEAATLVRALARPRRLGLEPRAARRLLVEAEPGLGRTVGLVLASASAAARGIFPAAAPGHTGFTGTSCWIDPPSGGFAVLLTNRVHPTVDGRDFQLVRRGFHRLALTRLRAGAN